MQLDTVQEETVDAVQEEPREVEQAVGADDDEDFTSPDKDGIDARIHEVHLFLQIARREDAHTVTIIRKGTDTIFKISCSAQTACGKAFSYSLNMVDRAEVLQQALLASLTVELSTAATDIEADDDDAEDSGSSDNDGVDARIHEVLLFLQTARREDARTVTIITKGTDTIFRISCSAKTACGKEFSYSLRMASDKAEALQQRLPDSLTVVRP